METDRESVQHRNREPREDVTSGGAEESVRAPDADERGGYLGFVAHEVRNPLSTALWTAELLARMAPEERGGARGEKLSAMCLRSLSRMRQLIEDHFLCERLDAAGIPLRLEPVPLAEVLDVILEKRPPESTPVVRDLEPGVVVEADRSLLERTLDSLIAVAASEGAPVRIWARTSDDTVAIEIRGAAPPAEALRDPRKGSPSDPKGRALALPVARRTVSALRGRLSLLPDGYALTFAASKTRPD
jgi:signal transduction histidine kinase